MNLPKLDIKIPSLGSLGAKKDDKKDGEKPASKGLSFDTSGKGIKKLDSKSLTKGGLGGGLGGIGSGGQPFAPSGSAMHTFLTSKIAKGTEAIPIAGQKKASGATVAETEQAHDKSSYIKDVPIEGIHYDLIFYPQYDENNDNTFNEPGHLPDDLEKVE